MPLYTYGCASGHQQDEIRGVEERHKPLKCDLCKKSMKLQIQTSVFDPRMGLDSGFPSAYDKWAKTRKNAAKG